MKKSNRMIYEKTMTMIFCLILLFGAGCSIESLDELNYKEVDVEKVLDATYVSETRATWAKTNITIDKGIFIIGGTLSVLKGDAITLRIYDGGKQFLCFESYPARQQL